MDNRSIKHILVAVDLDKATDGIIKRATELAIANKAKLTLLNVVQKKSTDEFLDNLFKKLLPKWLWLNTLEYKTSLMKQKIQSLVPGTTLAIEYLSIEAENPSQKILQVLKINRCDFLILGAHGKYTLRDIFTGTTAEDIAKRVHCPTLIVQSNPKKHYKSVLVPVDLSKTSKNAFDYAIHNFPEIKPTIIHVADYEFDKILNNEETKKVSKLKIIEVRKAITKYLLLKIKKLINGKKFPMLVVFGYPGPAIIKEANKKKWDLIVIGAQGHSKKHYIYVGHVANYVLSEINKDILIVPKP